MNNITVALNPSYLVAVVLVGFYAWTRFNTPKTLRCTTSRIQYYASAFAYVLSCIGVLMGLCLILRQEPGVLNFLHQGSSQPLPQDISGLDIPLVSALALTTLLPSFPFLRDVDQSMLSLFHRIGEIPVNAILWARRMSNASYPLSPLMLEDIREYIRGSSSLPNTLIDELESDPQSDLRYRFTRNLALLVAIEKLNNFAKFTVVFPEDSADFDQRIELFFAHSASFFTLCHQLSMSNLAPSPEAIENFKSLANSSHAIICGMMARVLLFTCRSEADIAKTLRGMGFTVEVPSPVHIPFNLLTSDLVGVLLIFLVSALIRPAHVPVGIAIAVGCFVAINHVIAGIFALIPKQFWRFADIRCANERPYLAYLISALCTLTVTLPLAWLFYQLRVHLIAPEFPPLAFHAQCKWLILPTLLSFALAFACDDYAHDASEPWWVRPAETIGLGLVMACGGWLAINWLLPDQIANHPHGNPPSLWPVAAMSASIGALFGGTIPTWYRKTLRRPTVAPRLGVPTLSPA